MMIAASIEGLNTGEFPKLQLYGTHSRNASLMFRSRFRPQCRREKERWHLRGFTM